jgi:hypothetical protein
MLKFLFLQNEIPSSKTPKIDDHNSKKQNEPIVQKPVSRSGSRAEIQTVD